MMLFTRSYIAGLLICSIIIILCAAPSEAASARDLYFQAEASYQELKKNPAKRKYRHNWLPCINKFQAVYKYDPTGSWAAAGLYMTGTLYRELYKFSANPSDKKEALDNFERLIKQFPNSGYRDRASEAIRSLSHRNVSNRRPQNQQKGNKKKNSAAEKIQYHRAEACYNQLNKRPEKQKYRENWLACIDEFQAVYDHNPNGPWAGAGLYKTGELYYQLYRRSRNAFDKKEAIEAFTRIVEEYPKSGYQPKAMSALRSITKDEDREVARTENKTSASSPKTSTGDKTQSQRNSRSRKNSNQEKRPDSIGRKTIVTGLRFWSNPNYTRIVIDADKDTTFTYNLLKRDPSIKKPQRLYVDLHNARLGGNIQKIIPIHDDLLSHARAGQYNSDSVRVVADIKSLKSYKVFSLKDPFRIVLDMRGGDADVETAPDKQSQTQYNIKDLNIPSKSLTKQLALRVRRIVIDPGHGGRDYGAPGYIKGVHEKYVTLQIAKKLAEKIRKELNCEVIMTRYGDRYLTLEERTAIANTQNADLFISIHTNANRDRRLYGISSYYLNFATDDDSIRVAARENATSTKNISDLQTILYSLMQNTKINESSQLAGYIQESMSHLLKTKGYTRIKSKGVRQAPFYVLLGADMPAVLIETSFISNSRDFKRLINSTYQKRLVEGIVI
ncbi:MAG: N-acetylmuramoyl-L-alanine amidase [Deltaproteobacteria bacterium]|nr:MAG: N-acetylmuramoyl-L-alanine amidase [Deltaproteobacteria bacterium]